MRSARICGMDADYLLELFAIFGPVMVRRMFGGAGLFADGVMFGLVARDIIYLKADEQTIPDFEREGLTPFTYAAKGKKRISLSYWRLPDRLYDDPDELAQWARQALMAAPRSVEGKRKRPRKSAKRRKKSR
jgi:DNA transformation protein and related proteins